ncbi:MAG TPA: NCS2 family permease, partial [Steroidobacteraceae bacterium]|nr:NCS2 family permease [Steroidobacteraceae bacterium]
FIGLQNAGLIVKDPGTAVRMNLQFASPDQAVFFTGLLVAGGLQARRVGGALLWGLLAAGALAAALKLALPHLPAWIAQAAPMRDSALVHRFTLAHAVVAAPPSLAPTLFKLDLRGAASWAMAPFIVVFLFMVFFDTVGTLVGVAQQAGLMRDGRLPRARQAFLSDALGTVAGACLGTSTVTSFIESATGVEQGGRTGLTAVVVALLFLAALFAGPVIGMLGSYPAVTAPALVLVGTMMLRNIAQLDWGDFTELLPSFLVVVGIPLGYSIADGLALGFVSYPVVKLIGGRRREARPGAWLLAALLLVYFVTVRTGAGGTP